MIWPQAFGLSRVECDSLSENGSHKVIHLNTQFSIHTSLLKELGGITFWGKGCHCGKVPRFKRPLHLSVSSLPAVCKVQILH